MQRAQGDPLSDIMEILKPDLDLELLDYCLFPKIKEYLAGKCFADDENLQDAVMNWLNRQAVAWYEEGTLNLVSGWDKCLNVQGCHWEQRRQAGYFQFRFVSMFLFFKITNKTLKYTNYFYCNVYFPHFSKSTLLQNRHHCFGIHFIKKFNFTTHQCTKASFTWCVCVWGGGVYSNKWNDF